MTLIRSYFYKIKTSDGVHVGRKYLDILTHPNLADIDLTIIMLNPGSASPTINAENIVVDSTPDPTINRIIKVMTALPTYRNCRILNLSDYKEPKSRLFFQAYGKSRGHNYFPGSLFSDNRIDELKSLFHPKTKVIIAWGASIDNTQVSKKAIEKLKSLGVEILNEKKPHFHPLVRKKNFSWHSHMIELLKTQQPTSVLRNRG